MIQSIIKVINQCRKTRVDLLAQDTVTEELKSNPGVGRVYSYGNGFFSPDAIESYLMEQLINKAYDYILIPMANNHLEGYRNVLEIARLIEPKFILGIYPEGSILTINEEKEAIEVLI